jgi:hypothetical protein
LAAERFASKAKRNLDEVTDAVTLGGDDRKACLADIKQLAALLRADRNGQLLEGGGYALAIPVLSGDRVTARCKAD